MSDHVTRELARVRRKAAWLRGRDHVIGLAAGALLGLYGSRLAVSTIHLPWGLPRRWEAHGLVTQALAARFVLFLAQLAVAMAPLAWWMKAGQIWAMRRADAVGSAALARSVELLAAPRGGDAAA
jgi:hypothetical protein